MTRFRGLVVLAMLIAAPAAAAQEGAGLVEEGRQAFVRNGCHGCHTVGRMGTPIAADLTHVGAKYRPGYLRRWLRDPSYLRPSTHMPPIELTEADIQALAAFLAAQE
jgi:mono/diheme cytochrome c family protein